MATWVETGGDVEKRKFMEALEDGKKGYEGKVEERAGILDV